MTIAAVVVGLAQLRDDRWDLWWRPVVLVAVGYLLQWMGHRIEGNDMGEVILVKKAMGRDYVAVSRRYGSASDAESASGGERERR